MGGKHRPFGSFFAMTEEKKVKIKVFAIVMRGEGDEVDKDNIRITSEGVMTLCDDRVEIAYEELMGEDGYVENVLSFAPSDPGVVTIVREGAASAVMTFSEKGRYKCKYDVGFANFDMTVATKSVKNGVTFEKGGVLLLDYSTEIQGVALQSSRFRFTITCL